MADPITLPVQQINADAGWAERAREKLREMYAQMTPTPAERARQEADAAKSFADLATTKGLVSRGLAHVLGPLQGSSLPATAGMSALEAYADDPQHRAGRALAAGAGAAALGAGASVAARKAAQLFGPAAGTAAAKVSAPVPKAVQPASPLPGSWDPAKVEQVLGNATARKAMKGESVATSEKALQRLAERAAPVRDPANMVPVARAGKDMMKKLTPAELEARRRWVHTNSSEIQAADARGETAGEYGQLAQTLKQMAAKYPSPPATLYRGAHLPADAVEQMTKSGKMVAPRMESWSTNPETSGAFARGKDIAGKVPVVFRQHGASGLALNPLESEVLIPHARNYRVAGVTKAADGTHIVDVVHAP